MNPLWNAAQAVLALVQECLDGNCSDYGRIGVDTTAPVFDCSSITVVMGNARAYSGSCVGRVQLRANLDITLVRCCDPVGELTGVGGYTPPPIADVEAAAACLSRDAWMIYECVTCQACSTIGAVKGVEACCDQFAGAPEIVWGSVSGGCRSVIVRIPLVFTTCCE